MEDKELVEILDKYRTALDKTNILFTEITSCLDIIQRRADIFPMLDINYLRPFIHDTKDLAAEIHALLVMYSDDVFCNEEIKTNV